MEEKSIQWFLKMNEHSQSPIKFLMPSFENWFTNNDYYDS